MIQIEMLKHALKKGYIVPAFNATNFEILKALIMAGEETKSPLILQFSESAINFFGDEILFGIIKGIRKMDYPISIHLDHAKNFDLIKKAIELGFDSVMIDGSTLPYENNVELTTQVVKYAHMHNVSVEGELGVLKVSEDDGQDGQEHFTNPIQAKDFVDKTGVDSLAISIGTNHGINKFVGEPKIRYDILSEIEKLLPNLPIVLHGASLVEKKYVDKFNQHGGEIKKAIGNDNLLKDAYKTNISKINMDTDFRLAFTSQLREFLNTNKSSFNPRDYAVSGIESVKNCAKDRIINICKSNNRV